MKRMAAIVLLFAFVLSGCSMFQERLREPVTFYYLQQTYQHGEADAVISSEQREASGHRQDLRYLMALYLMGPSAEELKLPLPRGTRILSAVQEGPDLTLEISDTSRSLSDIAYSLACSCLAMTCMELSDAESVTVVSGERTMTLSPADILLTDDQIQTTMEEPQ